VSGPEDFTATAALAALHDTRAAWAKRPPQKTMRYDVIYGSVVGVMIGGQALGAPLNVVASLGGGILVGLLTLRSARKSGVWVSGVGPKRARWVALGLGVVFILAAVGVFEAARMGMAWIGWPAGLAAGLVGFAASRLWRRVYRSDVADATDIKPDVFSRRPQLTLIGLGGAVIIAAVGFALATGQLGAEWFFYALGIGVGVMFMAVMMTVVRSVALRRRK